MKEISSVLSENIAEMKKRLSGIDNLILHTFKPSGKCGLLFDCALFCLDGMVDSRLISENIIRPVVTHEISVPVGKNRLFYLESSVLQVSEITEERDFDKLIFALLYGDSILFCANCEKALILGTKNFAKRGIDEPPSEPILKGPREGFSEPILVNISLLRRKLRTPDLKTEFFRLGDVTNTNCCICYIDGCISPDILNELKRRLFSIKTDGILDTNHLSELISEHKYSILRNTGSTERPDVACAKLLEGRAVVFVDGSPVALTVPYIFLESFQSPEDYYVNFYFAAINRFMRILGFLLSISIIPIFISITMFHRELIPSELLLSIAAARQGVPFGIAIEAIILLLAFEMLREAGSRTPSNTAQTLSIVGGLVVGQAAVDAHMVSSVMLIIIAFSGITGLIAPKVKPLIIWSRLGLILLSIFLGLYGFLLGMVWLLLLLSHQSSFGVPTLSSLPFMRMGSIEDSALRFPFNLMKKRGRFIAGVK